jgi:DNA-binding IclR family transcriptional regulator
MNEIPHADGNLRSVELSFGIIERLREDEGATLADISREFELAKSTVHSHLTTLTDLGYVIKENGTYRLSLRFLELGEEVRTLRPEYRPIVEHVETLADRFDERAQFIVEEGGKAVYIYRRNGIRAVTTDSAVGKHIPLHSTAAGKAILANLPRDRAEEIVASHGLDAVTEHTITDVAALFEELDRIRERGYAFNREENLVGLNAVGVPVRDADSDVLGALSVSGPSYRLDGAKLESEIPDFMLGMANEIELNLAYPS